MVRSQRFHVAFDRMLARPRLENMRYGCVRMSAVDDTSLEATPVVMDPVGYKDSVFSSPSVFVASANSRCFEI